jgi:gluconolactonase
MFRLQFVPAFIAASFLVSSCGNNAQRSTTADSDTTQSKTFGSIERIDSAVNEIISPDAKIEIIAEGFEWTEGPVWIPEHNMLLFSDIPPNTIYKWTEERGKEVYLKPSGYTGSVSRKGEVGSNGLLRDDEGRLVLCQHGDRRIAVMDAPIDSPKAEFITVADRYQGKRFDSPNDAVFRSNGDLFFTDPPYGLENYINDTSKAAPYQGVYKVSTEGEMTLLTDTITRPNGIAFLAGEKTLIVANSDPDRARWYAYDLDANDRLTNARIFYDATADGKNNKGLPDGLKVDSKGNVFATGPGGVWIFNAQGKVLGRIRIPEATSNCALADDDRTLYLTCDMYVVRVKLR